MAKLSNTGDEMRHEWPFCLFDDAELLELMADILAKDNGKQLYETLEAVKDDKDPQLQEDIRRVCSHPRLKALLRQ